MSYKSLLQWSFLLGVGLLGCNSQTLQPKADGLLKDIDNSVQEVETFAIDYPVEVYSEVGERRRLILRYTPVAKPSRNAVRDLPDPIARVRLDLFMRFAAMRILMGADNLPGVTPLDALADPGSWLPFPPGSTYGEYSLSWYADNRTIYKLGDSVHYTGEPRSPLTRQTFFEWWEKVESVYGVHNSFPSQSL